jgi:hypothetical protein
MAARAQQAEAPADAGTVAVIKSIPEHPVVIPMPVLRD